jgi:plastocyanin
MLAGMVWTATGVMATAAIAALAGTPIEQTAHGSVRVAGGMRVVRIADVSSRHDTLAVSTDRNQVAVDNFSFTPATVAVPVGTTVTWTNHDDIPHNVVSPEHQFKSPALDTGDVFSYTFAAAGTYKYYCSIHPRMTGEIVVR